MGLHKFSTWCRHSPELLLKVLDDPASQISDKLDALSFVPLLDEKFRETAIINSLNSNHEKVAVFACEIASQCMSHAVFKILRDLSAKSNIALSLAANDTLSFLKEEYSERYTQMDNVLFGLNEDHENKVELIQQMGTDEDHALSAWTSTSRELNDSKRSRIPSLLKMLAENGHHTPFEKSYIRFLVTSDIASHIHLLKHRVGVSINAESARYKELKDDKYYVPNDWSEGERMKYIEHMQTCIEKYHETLERLVSSGMSRKRAKESARFYLPYGNQIVSDISFNFRSFMHFQGLRNKPEAQIEISQIAKKMLQCVWESGTLKDSLAAFGWTEEKIYEK